MTDDCRSMGRFRVSTGHRYNNSLTRLGVDLSPHSECGRQPVVLADPIVGQSFTREARFKGTANRTSVDKVQVFRDRNRERALLMWSRPPGESLSTALPTTHGHNRSDQLCHRRAQLAIGNIITLLTAVVALPLTDCRDLQKAETKCFSC